MAFYPHGLGSDMISCRGIWTDEGITISLPRQKESRVQSLSNDPGDGWPTAARTVSLLDGAGNLQFTD